MIRLVAGAIWIVQLAHQSFLHGEVLIERALQRPDPLADRNVMVTDPDDAIVEIEEFAASTVEPTTSLPLRDRR